MTQDPLSRPRCERCERGFTLVVGVQEADGAPPAAELQEKLSLKSDDERSKTINGRLAVAAGLDRTVFDDF